MLLLLLFDVWNNWKYYLNYISRYYINVGFFLKCLPIFYLLIFRLFAYLFCLLTFTPTPTPAPATDKEVSAPQWLKTKLSARLSFTVSPVHSDRLHF